LILQGFLLFLWCSESVIQSDSDPRLRRLEAEASQAAFRYHDFWVGSTDYSVATSGFSRLYFEHQICFSSRGGRGERLKVRIDHGTEDTEINAETGRGILTTDDRMGTDGNRPVFGRRREKELGTV
jgi:hypothetical protein